jgi:hypothetical protein
VPVGLEGEWGANEAVYADLGARRPAPGAHSWGADSTVARTSASRTLPKMPHSSTRSAGAASV